MTKLHFCNTIYSCNPPSDLNPLILDAYKDKKVLAIVAREQQGTRISQAYSDKIKDGSLTILGWWDFPVLGLFTPQGQLIYKELTRFNAIVIISKDRIDEAFDPIYKALVSWIS